MLSKDLKTVADVRLDDAKILYHQAHYDGAAYLCGYVLEIALKARIFKLLDIDTYPDSGKYKQLYATHDFDVLLKLSGLEKEMALSKTKNPTLFLDWSIVTRWQPDMRYQVMNKTKTEVGQILVSLINLFKWLKK